MAHNGDDFWSTQFSKPTSEIVIPLNDHKNTNLYSNLNPSSLHSSQRVAHLLSNLSSTVDLHVTNLDQSIGAKEMKILLNNVFKQHVMVCTIIYCIHFLN